MANPKLEKFKKALEEYEDYKQMLKKQLGDGQINKDQYTEKLTAKCKQLDL